MSDILHALADVTGTRDRDVVDVSVTFLLQDMLKPRAVAIRWLVDDGRKLLLERTAMRAGDAAPAFGARGLRAIDSWSAAERACLEERRVVEDGEGRTCFPIVVDGAALGLLEVETETALDTRQLDFVTALLRIYRNHVSLLEYGQRDTLTGLLNRRTFEERFARAVQNGVLGAGALERPYWIAVVDIDHFKSVNDRFGHLIGDEVLILFARLAARTIRPEDLAFRFGGEEFVLLLERAELETIEALLERFRATVEAHAFPQVGRVTASIGYTAVAVDDTVTHAFERADKAVYAAKGEGRNRVRGYEALIAAGVLAKPQAVGDDIELF